MHEDRVKLNTLVLNLKPKYDEKKLCIAFKHVSNYRKTKEMQKWEKKSNEKMSHFCIFANEKIK